MFDNDLKETPETMQRRIMIGHFPSVLTIACSAAIAIAPCRAWADAGAGSPGPASAAHEESSSPGKHSASTGSPVVKGTLSLIAGTSLPIQGLNYGLGAGVRGGVSLGPWYIGAT